MIYECNLIGFCNNDETAQVNMGTLYRSWEDKNVFMVSLTETIFLTDGSIERRGVNLPVEIYKRPGVIVLTCEKAWRGHGFSIRLDQIKGKYRFTTGLNAYDSGSSGMLAPFVAETLLKMFAEESTGITGE